MSTKGLQGCLLVEKHIRQWNVCKGVISRKTHTYDIILSSNEIPSL